MEHMRKDINLELDSTVEQAEFLTRIMIDANLSKNDLEIGLSLLHKLLTEIKNSGSIKLD